MLVLVWLVLCFSKARSIIVEIPDDVGEYCPYSDICNRSAKANLNIVGKHACCQECSCAEDCGMRLNCCFEEFDKYKLLDNGLVACINSFEGQTSPKNRISFYMIQICFGKESNLDRPCLTQDEQGHSLIAPVSSTATGKIYVNADCAKCNGLVDFTPWKALLVFNARVSPISFHLDFRDIVSNTRTLYSILYMPPPAEGWYKHECFNEFVSGFSNNCTNDKLSAVCANLNAPYTDIRGTFKNVYCWRCKNDLTKITLECEDYSYSRSSFSGSLSMLLDYEAIGNLKSNNNKKAYPSQIDEECVKDFEAGLQEECLRVYCPEGMTDNAKGCSYFGLWWHSAYFLMQVKLVAVGSQRLPVSTIMQLDLTDRTNPLNWVHPPCKDVNLTEMEVYYEHSGNETDRNVVNSFIVAFGRNTVSSDGFDPAAVIPLMKQCIDNTWRMKINGTTYLFSASFDEYTKYVQNGIQRLSKYSVEDKSFIFQTKPDPAIFEGISSTQDYNRNKIAVGIWLRKSFFCKQVRLSIDKVEIDFGRIKILSKNITIGSNKYTFNGDTAKQGGVDNGTLSFSVCLEDYLSYNNNNGFVRRYRDVTILLYTIVWCRFVIL